MIINKWFKEIMTSINRTTMSKAISTVKVNSTVKESLRKGIPNSYYSYRILDLKNDKIFYASSRADIALKTGLTTNQVRYLQKVGNRFILSDKLKKAYEITSIDKTIKRPVVEMQIKED